MQPATWNLHLDSSEDAGICVLNEVGLDPGMDHMSAMKIIDDVHSRGGEITSFSSVCGGMFWNFCLHRMVRSVSLQNRPTLANQ